MEAAEEKSLAEESGEGSSSTNHNFNFPPLPMLKAGESNEIVEESLTSQNEGKEKPTEIPSQENEPSRVDCVMIDMPLSSIPTPKRVNFSPLPSPNHVEVNGSPGPTSSKYKSSTRNFLPKLSFQFRSTNSESPRTFSLTKIFGPKMTRTSSLPATPVVHSNPESVTLLRIQSTQAQGNRTRLVEMDPYRIWQDVPLLVIVSMLAYFCFLEQLLVRRLGSSAIAVSLPFSCILGLLASMTSTSMVRRKYSWIYATIQFALVVLFAQIFYSLLHVQAVLSVVLATFAGFGGTMCVTSIMYELMKWRWWNTWTHHQRDSTQLNQSPDGDDMPQMNSQHRHTENINEGVDRGS